MPSAKQSAKPAKKPPVRKRNLHRFDCSESWCLHHGDEQIALVTRHRGGEWFNVYLGSSDEPRLVTFNCWEDAKDYVFQKLNISRGRRVRAK
jgi:hypothetical protein